MDLTIKGFEMRPVQKSKMGLNIEDSPLEITRYPDIQEVEEGLIYDPEFDRKLMILDRALERIPFEQDELKIYVIESILIDDSDIENLRIVENGLKKFGPVEQYCEIN